MLIPVKYAKKQGRWRLYRGFTTNKRYLMIGYYGSAYDSCAVILSNQKVGRATYNEESGQFEADPTLRYEWHVLCQGPEFSFQTTFEKDGFLWGQEDEKGTLKAKAMQAAERDFDAALRKYAKKKR